MTNQDSPQLESPPSGTSLVIMGVAGCGKSTLAAALSAAWGLPLLDGDDFHTDSHRLKMAGGQALTDADRDGWLDRLCAQLASRPAGVVLSCSALKLAYRERLRRAAPGLRFVFLRINAAAASERVRARAQTERHFFSSQLMSSQFATLESPVGEAGVLALDALCPPAQLLSQVGVWLAEAQAQTHPALLQPIDGGERYALSSPLALPKAGGFLWNRKMMIQMNCRGYAVAQFMQPEPAKYAHGPQLEAKSFMQPEQAYYAHHPGRFFYVKDEDTGQLFSAPYEPVRQPLERYCFKVGRSDLSWLIEQQGLRLELRLGLSTDDVVELWSLRLTNLSGRPRRISVYPYFPIGYMSWMNQSAEYRADLGGIVASSVTPYQKVADYFKNQLLKDKTFFLCERQPDAWEANQAQFEGEGGLQRPTALEATHLAGGDARYETPTACVQYRLALQPNETQDFRFLFGPALDDAEITRLRERYLSEAGFARADQAYRAYIDSGRGCLQISTPDPALDNFANHWLARQVFYHGDVNRLSTDPQTRNYLQDNLGMAYIAPSVTRAALLHALSQQERDGAMPDGILLFEGAELKYINQVPHTDHCVWLPLCLRAYLDESADYALLNEPVSDARGQTLSVAERLNLAMQHLLNGLDARGLSYIAQGDWCDPMNMVGYKGRGVSGWLSLAAAYALKLWAGICDQVGHTQQAVYFRSGAEALNAAANRHLWDGAWYARGITDDNIAFGVSRDVEGRIFLNPQAWALLSGAADAQQTASILAEVAAQLSTPYGVAMFAPPYSAMRDDIGRVTQKHPGSAENGAVYNHAAMFYIFSLYEIGEGERAYQLLRQMLPGPDLADYLQRGQMPVFLPNYYRGAQREYPRTAGRSSQLFNTGTAAWAYRCLIEGLCGLRGDAKGLTVRPQLPTAWAEIRVQRLFRGACFKVHMRRTGVAAIRVRLNGELQAEARVDHIRAGETYNLDVELP